MGARAGIASGIDSWRALRTNGRGASAPCTHAAVPFTITISTVYGQKLTPGWVQLALLGHTNYTYGDDRHASDVESLIHKVNAEGPDELALGARTDLPADLVFRVARA